jgi:hypothetical protein
MMGISTETIRLGPRNLSLKKAGTQEYFYPQILSALDSHRFGGSDCFRGNLSGWSLSNSLDSCVLDFLRNSLQRQNEKQLWRFRPQPGEYCRGQQRVDQAVEKMLERDHPAAAAPDRFLGVSCAVP